MIGETFFSSVGVASFSAFAGFGCGLAYFMALRRTAALFSAEGGWLEASALTLGRIGAVTILMAVAARLGAGPLLATFLGFLLARAIMLRLAKEPP